MVYSLFHEVAKLQACNFAKKRHEDWCFPVTKFLRNIFFKEHLRKAASEVTLRSDCLELCFWNVAFKTILTQYYNKNISHFQTRALNTHRRICRLYI